MRTRGQILDVRNANDFAAAHLAGGISIGLGGEYATRDRTSRLPPSASALPLRLSGSPQARQG